jgi:hypothetical protein
MIRLNQKDFYLYISIYQKVLEQISLVLLPWLYSSCQPNHLLFQVDAFLYNHDSNHTLNIHQSLRIINHNHYFILMCFIILIIIHFIVAHNFNYVLKFQTA